MGIIRNKILRYLLALPFLLAAIYHLLALLISDFGEPASDLSHIAFIAINSAMTGLHYWRPKWFFIAACLLIIQQLYSHGVYGYQVYQQQNRIDWYSVIVLLGFPLYLLVYWRWFLHSRQ